MAAHWWVSAASRRRFLFVPPGVPHQAVNLSEIEPAVAIIARNDANEQERVVPYRA